MTKSKNRLADLRDQSTRDLEICPDVYTPADQIRAWVTDSPTDLKILLPGASPAKP